MPRTRKKNALQLYCKFGKKKKETKKTKQNKTKTFTSIMVYSIALFSVSALNVGKQVESRIAALRRQACIVYFRGL